MSGWTPTRAAGLRRLQTFLPRAGRDYARERNAERGPDRHDNVSTLSPWIRHRLMLESEVARAALEHHGLPAAEKFVQEVCWRTYWKGWLERRPGIWSGYRREFRNRLDELERGSELRSRWEAATSGRTGIECFDHWARELTDTNYLHNHARMWFASIWIFTLDLPWALGADFFLRHLLDGDPASNTLSWRWVAGLHTPGKTYLARAENIARHTGGRFDPAGQLATRAPAPPVPDLPEPSPVPGTPDPGRRGPTGLLLTEEDLHPDFLLGEHRPFDAILLAQATDRRSPLPVAPAVHGFVEGALGDALVRLAGHGAVTALPTRGPGAVDALVEHARAADLSRLLTPYLPVGPTAEALAPLAGRLAAAGIELVPVLRPWDEVAWQHATRGFFAFWKRLRPGITSAAGVPDPDPS